MVKEPPISIRMTNYDFINEDQTRHSVRNNGIFLIRALRRRSVVRVSWASINRHWFTAKGYAEDELLQRYLFLISPASPN